MKRVDQTVRAPVDEPGRHPASHPTTSTDAHAGAGAPQTLQEMVAGSPRQEAQRRHLDSMFGDASSQAQNTLIAQRMQPGVAMPPTGKGPNKLEIERVGKTYVDDEDRTRNKVQTINFGGTQGVEPGTLFGSLRREEKEDRLVPKEEHVIRKFSVRKPKVKEGHWAMYFCVGREGKDAKALKVDLIQQGYRIVYQAETVPYQGFSGDVEWYSVDALAVATVYEYLARVANAKGGYEKLGAYDCQEFVRQMLALLVSHHVERGEIQRFE
jgi:hypothetical protein